MGNHQAHPQGQMHVIRETTDDRRRGFINRRRQKLEELKCRRQSMPSTQVQLEPNPRHDNFHSFCFGEDAQTPRIQINGQDSVESVDLDNQPGPSTPPERRQSDLSPTADLSASHTCVSIDSAEEMNQNAPKKHRFIRNPKSAATRRMEFLSFSNNFAARSLDEGAHFEAQKVEFELDMKPLSHRARSLSPLKQMRTYSSRKFPSDESVLTSEHCAFIKISWKMAMERIQTTNQPSFGFLCMKRILEKMSMLKEVFKVSDIENADRLPPDHTFARHVGLFQSILDLAVRNVEQLETEIAPLLFTYGKRHYQHNLLNVFNESTVRLFCGQVVCTMLDLLSDRLTTDSMEAWIELMRYLGRALFNGFEYERLAKTKKFAINTKDHAYFIA